MTRDLLILSAAVAILAALSGGCSEDGTTGPAPDTITVIFRDGSQPDEYYYGTRDAVLKDGPTTELINGNFGLRDVDTLGAVALSETIYERRLILRFDMSTVSDCASVYSAHLTLSISPGDTSAIELAAYEADVPPAVPVSWAEGTGGTAGGVSWQTVDGTYPWTAEGGDYLTPVMDIESVRGDTTVTFELPADRVWRWMKYPQTNHGILVMPLESGEEGFMRVYMRESADPRLRPELVVRYRKSG
jgi:hypothetical protein